MQLLQDTNIWVAMSFVIFAFFAFRIGRKVITDGIEKKITAIRQDISAAETMRMEAQELLAQYQRKHKEAEAEAARIIASAKETAQSLQKDAEEKLKTEAKRREDQLEERIRFMEEKAIQDIRNYAADLTLRATSQIIASNMNEQENNRLSEDAIKSLAK